MKRFLITISLGPVQSLIAAARRTRDLWCGSWALSEASRAAAWVLHKQQPECLIFPCPENPLEDLKPQDEPRETANVANILRAEVTLSDDAAVRALCNEAKDAARSRMTELGGRALEKLEHRVRKDVWQVQIEDILESYSAWVEIGESDDYSATSRRLGSVIKARKSTRDFRPCATLSVHGLPKSSLDGGLETVLPDWPAGDPARARLALTAGEQLDALGVIKRLAGQPEQFTAWPRIAADPWIEQLALDQQQQLSTVYEPLVKQGIATRVRGNSRIYEAMPFDGHLLYPSRIGIELAHARKTYGSDSKEMRSIEKFHMCIREIWRQGDSRQPNGVPVPYAAVLKADGDRMGRLLGHANNADQSRDISRALHRFASDVAGKVREHRGHAIYAGGDDVLALVPLSNALECARSLAESFAVVLGETASKVKLPDGEWPTLSVGLGIGHVLEPLGALRARATQAEHDAKGNDSETPRNALAIRLGIRSGMEICWRDQWQNTDAFTALNRFTAAYRSGELPTRVAYDLQGIARRLSWLGDRQDETANGMRKAEVERVLDRAQRDGGSGTIPAELRDLIRERSTPGVKELADTLILARWLSARTAADLGEES